MVKAIYTVTVFQKIARNPKDSEDYIPDFGDLWCVGWFDNWDEANCAVTNNFDNIHDNFYDYAIIEKVEPGIFSVDIDRTVYQWNPSLDGYREIETPEEVNKSSNFGIG